MTNTGLKIVALVMAIYVSFLTIFQNIAVNAAERFTSQGSKPPEGATCYIEGPSIITEDNVENLNNQLKTLEEVYKKKQISKNLYDKRKADILNRIKKLEKGKK